MRALFVHADGRTFVEDATPASYVIRDDGTEWKNAGSAVNQNTLFDGTQLVGCDGPPNRGQLVFIETIPERVRRS